MRFRVPRDRKESRAKVLARLVGYGARYWDQIAYDNDPCGFMVYAGGWGEKDHIGSAGEVALYVHLMERVELDEAMRRGSLVKDEAYRAIMTADYGRAR